MAYTEVTSQSWISRMGSSIKGIFFGIILIVVAMVIEWTNEGRAVKTERSLEEGAEVVISVPSDNVNATNNGQLVYTMGWADATGTLTDTELGVTFDGIKLKRDVEIYQWKESSKSATRKKLGGGEETVTTYTYSQGWTSQPINSANFKEVYDHENKGALLYQNASQVAPDVKVGAFQLPASLIGRIGNYQPVSTNEFDFSQINGAQNTGSGLYIGNRSEGSPAIGDIRVKFAGVAEQQVSIVAKQIQSTFEPYKADAGKGVLLLSSGTVSAANMFESALEANTMLTWILRLAGIFLMFAGFRMIFKPIVTVGDVVPFIGNLLSMGLGLVSGILAFAISFVVMSIAWIIYRPWVGIAMLAIGIGSFVFLKYFSNKKAATQDWPDKLEPMPVETDALVPVRDDVAPAAKVENGSASMADKLRDLKQLLDEGVITQGEFEREKKEVLDS